MKIDQVDPKEISMLFNRYKKKGAIIDRYWNMKTVKFWNSRVGKFIGFIPILCFLGLLGINIERLVVGNEAMIITWSLSFISLLVALKLKKVTGFILKRSTFKGKIKKLIIDYAIQQLPKEQQSTANLAVEKHSKYKRFVGAIWLTSALGATFFLLFDVLINTDPNAAIRECFSLSLVLNLLATLYLFFFDEITFSLVLGDYSVEASRDQDRSTIQLKGSDRSVNISTSGSETSGSLTKNDGSEIKITADSDTVNVETK